MKITSVEIYRFSIPMVPFTIATGTMNFAQNVFIRIYTDTQLYGVGECSAFPMIVGETQETCLAMARDFARLWLGKDPLDIQGRMNELHLFTARNTTIKSAFDMALFDLSAKYHNLPLYEFLGGAPREIETDITIGLNHPKKMAGQAKEFADQGANILKVKLGKDAETDIKRMENIRTAVGAKIHLRIDANQGWSFDTSKFILNELKALNIQFCEQPMPAYFDYLLPRLIDSSVIPVMADESCYNHYDAQRLIAQKASDAINIKLSKSGGILEALEIYKTACNASIPCMIGGMLESRIALSAKLHFAYACPEIKYYDLDTCMLGHLEDPCVDGVHFDGFNLSISGKPGIGADANEKFLRKCEKFVVQ